jgi:hypothetical protein
MKFPTKKIEKSSIKSNTDNVVDNVDFEIQPKKINKGAETKKSRLTKKEAGFVKDFARTGHGVQSALNNYDTDNYFTAGSIASENLKKPKIIKALADAFPNELLQGKHLQLLNAVTLQKLNFSVNDTDEEIREAVSQMTGYKLIYIKSIESSSGLITDKYAYVKAPDSMTQDKALDKAYKIRGDYAPEKKELSGINGEPLFSNEHKNKSDDALRQIIN